MNSEFLTSATKEGEYPEADRPEIVVVGRSNVGKSSFINAFTNRKKLAYVGKRQQNGYAGIRGSH